SFGAAVELAVAMPLSWLPVVGDYTREAKRPGAGATMATIMYFVGSCWMFAIGLGCALFAGSDDIAAVMAQAGMGIVGILVVVLSTVTTTFLDAQSAGVSAESIHPKLNARICGIIAAVVGTALAIFAPVSNFEEFLYLIGSVFAPMAAIVIADYFIGHRDRSDVAVDWRNIMLWVLGFALYRVSLTWDIPCGNTLPVMVVIVLAAFVVEKVVGKPSTASE
ncbi:MAG: cytosine permease, partial [Eggerthellaceae bacterium]|nr:cytosine permease [Eggerthellaceae bacterium]